MDLRRGIFGLIALFVLFSSNCRGQMANEKFGKNRIQYRTFDWQYLSGENFDIYYYDSRKEIAREALEFLESEFDRITDIIGYPPYFKTKVFLYNSLADLRQSNVGLNRNIFTVGGETEFVKPYVEIAHLGNMQEFKEELLYKISDLMVNEMMFGGNLKDIFQSALLLNLPEWFVDGASYYVAKGWTAEMDDFIRQFLQKKRLRKLGKLTSTEAALAGQSMWNFIAEKYGKSNIANILNYTRVTRNEEKSILITLGISFKQLMIEWERYYSEMGAMVNKSYSEPSDSTLFTFHHNKTTQITTVKISPDGKYVAYAENDRGRYIVKVREFGREKEMVIISGGSKVINQRVDYNLPLISWADAHTLGVIGLKNGEYVFWLYDLSTKTKLPRELDRFSNVRSLDFSNNGRLVILSADFEGQNDLFLISSRRDRVRRLTNDIYDDLDPNFIPGGNGIVFSSNRTSDSLIVGKKIPMENLTDNYNLFIFDLDTTKTQLTRVTNTLSKDFAPLSIDGNNFVYLSDQRGIINLFRYNRETGIYSQISNYSYSIRKYDLNMTTRNLAVVTVKDRKENIFIDPAFNLDRQIFTPATRRKEIQQARIIRERREVEQNKNMSIKDLLNERLKQTQQEQQTPEIKEIKPDSVAARIPADTATVVPDSIKVQNLPVDSVKTAEDTLTIKSILNKKKEETVNTDDYQFEEEPAKNVQPSESFLTRYMKAREKNRITGPFPYESKFSADNLVTSLVVDPLRGLGILIETQMNDMLENYRFFGGIMTTIDLRNSDAYAEFQYLPAFIDFSARLDRKAIRWEPEENDGDIYHYSLIRLEVGGSMPISDRTRFTLKPLFEMARSVNQGPVSDLSNAPPFKEPVNNYYGGLRSELVYDNSVTTGMNIIEGTRGKISFVHHQGLNNEDLSFSQVSVDVRHYQKIYKEIVFAVRGFGGSFFGRSPKKYLLGGMDNWFFNDSQRGGTTSDGEPNPLGIYTDNQDLLFTEFATGLRGFDYATLFGNNALLFNAELRMPLARAIAGSPISSNFFRNMQFIAFYDMGTSWSGEPPFNSQNSVSYKVIKGGPFEAQLKNYLNPWLYSYGVGMRSVMLGYYLKFDVAWPVENYKVGDPRLFVTLGFDF
ncbi:MAG TPA: translocation protein TolB [Cyclobacteriaceae bacterium]|nr:translocation protein TolB [Cyclobacteriaceae bacterium]